LQAAGVARTHTFEVHSSLEMLGLVRNEHAVLTVTQ
jgi:hypothetical protein